MKSLINKICIGTAQFNQKYGISNNNVLKKKDFYKILDIAIKHNIFNIDTAQNYSSEKELGKYIYAHGIENIVKISSKFIINNNSLNSFEKDLKRKIEISLTNLKCPLDSFLLHDISQIGLLARNIKFLKFFEKNYPINRFGFSIYDFKDYLKIKKLKKNNFVLQYPKNLLNSKFNAIKKKKNEKHFIRSIFLQGLLLNNPVFLKNEKIRNFRKEYLQFLDKKKLDSEKICLSHAFTDKKVDLIVIGFNSSKQLKNIINVVKNNDFIEIKKDINEFFDRYKNKNFIDPRTW